jgi:hypothetical protein
LGYYDSIRDSRRGLESAVMAKKDIRKPDDGGGKLI